MGVCGTRSDMYHAKFKTVALVLSEENCAIPQSAFSRKIHCSAIICYLSPANGLCQFMCTELQLQRRGAGSFRLTPVWLYARGGKSNE